MGFDKIYGAQERQDGLTKIGRKKYEAQVGYGTDEAGNGWSWRKQYRYKPTLDEVKADVLELINGQTDEKILSGYEYEGAQVWLTTENQFNYKAAYDMAVQTNGATLPVKIKIGTEEQPVYVTFNSVNEFGDFYMGALTYIQTMLEEGWKEKDAIDWTKFECNE